MREVKKSIILFVIFVILLIQTGCWDKKQYEEIGFILQMGLETDKDGNLLYSMTSPVVGEEVKSKVEFLHTSSERLIRASRERIRNVSGKMLQGGKVQHVYFSKDLAQKGVDDFLEIFFRDPQNPLLANVVVVDGSPKEMMELSLEYKDKPRSAIYISELLRDARRRSAAPETRVYNFSVLNYSKTIDPVTPLLRYDNKNIEIAGSALFSRDKMVGEIDTEQTMLLNMLIGKKGDFEYIYRGQEASESEEKIKRGAALLIRNHKRKIDIDISGNAPVIDIKLDLKSFLDEYAGPNNLDDEENKKKLEERIAMAMQDDTLNLLKHFQAVGSDPVGFGEIVRAKHNQYWKANDWKEVYKNAVFNLDVKVNIQSYGAIN